MHTPHEAYPITLSPRLIVSPSRASRIQNRTDNYRKTNADVTGSLLVPTANSPLDHVST